jgi:hypothetical protein
VKKVDVAQINFRPFGHLPTCTSVECESKTRI